MIGKCLCGRVEFEILGTVPNIYQCHCSQCRKITGSSSSSSTLVRIDSFKWMKGQEFITSYLDVSGYRSDFCSRCGSPVPNPIANKSLYWVPVGLMEDIQPIKIVAHLCVASKAAWDVISAEGAQFEAVPELPDLISLLHSRSL